jgi:hypothetical protein
VFVGVMSSQNIHSFATTARLVDVRDILPFWACPTDRDLRIVGQWPSTSLRSCPDSSEFVRFRRGISFVNQSGNRSLSVLARSRPSVR